MTTPQASLHRTKLLLLASVSFPVIGIVVSIALRKNILSYGATDRLVMTVIAVVAGLVATVGFIIASRRHR